MQLTKDTLSQVDFAKSELIPAIVQDARSGVILMQGFMNQDALAATFDKQKVTFYSRSKERLWTKGETSENYLEVVSVHTDCDYDSLLVLANPLGPTCHLGTQSCFGDDAKPSLSFLAELEQVIVSRKDDDPSKSYTASLFAKDLSRSCQKVGEEGVEVALAAMKHDNDELTNESADLLYHLTVLLQRQGLSLADVVNCLQGRHK
ncbi:bifunctional phosphoribosyl-AMP cyclohydrolase/phosphoribosyl-ATP diphosphatase HisIE [Pseudoalteromonas sp. B5MOD-1]|jgi:phosphoribosyl-ATP pyrophosphohydrolase/phosphoribosyl-AMP cyclohydrolase|uniref:bifunctional phosphoribosyl-AMP cyclohydrolase/phosphoribosyl-ATP diphosphatase HisIE n=1 Tax=Pseudoalteromonas TaxID=53246 RepID=UPI0007822BE3|nr:MULTISPECIES: bifunctional phosphoribosyl-AMP cyclohydrolase/phosphoribosyl-ATP diphosphatase HisIE [Pseudoalteromonas]MBD57461.1 bifunctional phosphoribosyl-AMP cyclohydrolase/phosphoribosyl-ATP diphosphatase HisIE [Pseudoalteromonas sp.]MCF2920009.1 bifunctional phosphoribosyl-AMP cyclohydrolase/phosphoribosyl-ATP diphosphatase HisIE [Pseudoalteromonas sp. APAL1]MCO7205070.1 bifunctional phosphoribosyl-AMP cyclohydrolase/phosphoribosyl-ATP diphosphatase HisIE [Pseudoalteromonas sp. CnMc7-37|tara:strand:+ start:510 stop:1124 length:615 start_codon:yes stop_codon:yes gene_type:complete